MPFVCNITAAQAVDQEFVDIQFVLLACFGWPLDWLWGAFGNFGARLTFFLLHLGPLGTPLGPSGIPRGSLGGTSGIPRGSLGVASGVPRGPLGVPWGA